MVVCIIISILNCWIVISVSGGLNGATSHAHGMHEETSRRPSSVSSISTIVRYTFFPSVIQDIWKFRPVQIDFTDITSPVFYIIYIYIYVIYIYIFFNNLNCNKSCIPRMESLDPFLIYNYREAHLLHMTSDNIIIFD